MKAILKPRDSIAVGWAVRIPAIETVPTGMSPGNASTRSGAIEDGPEVVQFGIDTHDTDGCLCTSRLGEARVECKLAARPFFLTSPLLPSSALRPPTSHLPPFASIHLYIHTSSIHPLYIYTSSINRNIGLRIKIKIKIKIKN